MHLDKLIPLIPGSGMMLVGALAAFYWRRRSGAEARWFWLGAGLWSISVALKLTWGILTNPFVIGLLKPVLSYPLLYVVCQGLYVGVRSSIFEMGFTILAGLTWRQLGKDASRAIAIGVGAGAFEALFLGLRAVVPMALVVIGAPGTTEEAAKAISAAGRRTAPMAGGAGRESDLRAGSCGDPSSDLAGPHVPQAHDGFLGFLDLRPPRQRRRGE